MLPEFAGLIVLPMALGECEAALQNYTGPTKSRGIAARRLTAPGYP
jgi:hypothetical protein